MTDLPRLLWSTLLLRPYVFAFLAAYLLFASRDLGVLRALATTALAYGIAFASEYASIHTGFPYGWYRYLPEATRGREVWVLGQVPLADSISYAFVAYASWSLARLWRARADGSGPGRGALATVLLAAVLMTLADVVVDPIATAGDEWFLGKIHEYPGGGAHFGVPLSNYGGWLLTAAAIVGAWAAADRVGGPRSPDTPRRAAPGAALYGGVVLFALSVTWVVALRRTDPIRRGEGLLLAGTSGLLVAALAAATAVSVRRNRRLPPPGGDCRQGPEAPGLPFPG